MKLMVNKQLLIEAVRKVNRVQNADDCLHFETHIGQMELSRRGRGIEIVSTVPVDANEELKFVVSARHFTSVLLKMMGDSVTISVYSDAGCRIICGKTRLTLTLIPCCWEKQSVSSSEEFVFHDIQQDIMEVIHGLGNNSCNHYSRNINFQFAENGYRMTATDGRKLSVRMTIPDENVKGAFMIPGEGVKIVSEILKNPVTMRYDGSFVTFSDGNTQVTSQIPFGSYPPLESQIRKVLEKMPYMILVDRDAFVRAIEIAHIISDDVVLVMDKNQILVKAKGAKAFGDTAVEYLSNASIKLEKKQFVFQALLLLEAAKSVSEPQIQIRFRSADYMIVIPGEKYLESVCPKRAE